MSGNGLWCTRCKSHHHPIECPLANKESFMHNWGEVDSQGRDICERVEEVSKYIGEWLRKWGRIQVWQYKEKFGTVRVYAHFGWEGLYSITRPGYAYIPLNTFKWRWVRKLDFIVIPLQTYMYRLRYKQAVKKWPELKEEILSCADYSELLRGL